jgi:hypothetical protein
MDIKHHVLEERAEEGGQYSQAQHACTRCSRICTHLHTCHEINTTSTFTYVDQPLLSRTSESSSQVLLNPEDHFFFSFVTHSCHRALCCMLLIINSFSSVMRIPTHFLKMKNLFFLGRFVFFLPFFSLQSSLGGQDLQDQTSIKGPGSRKIRTDLSDGTRTVQWHARMRA